MTCQITSKHILSSIGEHAPRITSLQLRYPLIIHAELMTHRQFSRNARSSRAVPVKRMIEEVMTDPFIPRYWGKNQKGMQAGEEWNAPIVINGEAFTNVNAWLYARDEVVKVASAFEDAEYHKQIVNRLLMPWLHIDTLVTSTSFSNWEWLRISNAAEPHIRDLAIAMRESMVNVTPQVLKHGDWHLPYVTGDDWVAAKTRVAQRVTPDKDIHPIMMEALGELVKLSVPRCAAISYKPFHEGDRPFEVEIAKHDELATNGHWSPFEHQAQPDRLLDVDVWAKPKLHGNLWGWRQYRKTFEGECA